MIALLELACDAQRYCHNDTIISLCYLFVKHFDDVVIVLEFSRDIFKATLLLTNQLVEEFELGMIAYNLLYNSHFARKFCRSFSIWNAVRSKLG